MIIFFFISVKVDIQATNETLNMRFTRHKQEQKFGISNASPQVVPVGIQSEKSCERGKNHNTNNHGEEMEPRVQNISSSNFDLEATQLIDRVQNLASTYKSHPEFLKKTEILMKKFREIIFSSSAEALRNEYEGCETIKQEDIVKVEDDDEIEVIIPPPKPEPPIVDLFDAEEKNGAQTEKSRSRSRSFSSSSSVSEIRYVSDDDGLRSRSNSKSSSRSSSVHYVSDNSPKSNDDNGEEIELEKWNFLQHNGPLFPPPYDPLPENVNFFYKGKQFHEFFNNFLSPEIKNLYILYFFR